MLLYSFAGVVGINPYGDSNVGEFFTTNATNCRESAVSVLSAGTVIKSLITPPVCTPLASWYEN